MRELTKQEIDNVLLKVRDGVLALTDGKLPYCIPFGFVYVNEAVYLSMLPTGRKWCYLQQNPMVCFSVFCWNEDYTEWFSVVIEGQLEQVKILATIELVIKANIEKIGLDSNKYLEKRLIYYKKTLDNPKSVKIFKLKAKEKRGRKMHTMIGS